MTISDPLPPGTTFVSAVPTNGTCSATAGAVTCAVGDLTPGQSGHRPADVLLAANLGETTLTNRPARRRRPPTRTRRTTPRRCRSGVTRRADLKLTKAITQRCRRRRIAAELRPDAAQQRAVRHRRCTHRRSGAGRDDLHLGERLRRRDVRTGAGRPDHRRRPRRRWCAAPGPSCPSGPPARRPSRFGVPGDGAGRHDHQQHRRPRRPRRSTRPRDRHRRPRPVVARSDMSVTKSLISGTPIAGGTVRWQLVARNAGPSVATGVTVADVAPAGVTSPTSRPRAARAASAPSPLCTLGTCRSAVSSRSRSPARSIRTTPTRR